MLQTLFVGVGVQQVTNSAIVYFGTKCHISQVKPRFVCHLVASQLQ